MRRHVLPITTALLAGGTLLAPLAAAQSAPAQAKTVQLSVSTSGQQATDINGRMARPQVNADGSVVVFDSIAKNLVHGDTNRSDDVFVRDRTTGETTRVSVSSSGVQGNEDSSRPDVSGDGRYVVYDSGSTNLVDAPDQNGVLDVFRYDRVSQTTTLVSESLSGGPGNASSFGPAISANGRFVAFTSDATDLTRRPASGARDVLVRDMQTGKTRIASLTQDGTAAGGASSWPAISQNGRYVAFGSFASDVVPGDTNDDFDVFVRDRKLGQTTRVSVDSAGAEAVGGGSYEAAISNDGRRVAFASDATNLVADDTNAARDVFVHDSSDGTTVRVSVGAGGVQGDGQSDGPGIRGGTTFGPDISGDGRYVVFDSIATNLVPDDTNTCTYGGGASYPGPGQCPDIFLRDLQDQTTTRMSVSTSGQQANDASTDPAISGNGRAVVFFSAAAFVARDTNTCPPFFLAHAGQCPDIYLHSR